MYLYSFCIKSLMLRKMHYNIYCNKILSFYSIRQSNHEVFLKDEYIKELGEDLYRQRDEFKKLQGRIAHLKQKYVTYFYVKIILSLEYIQFNL